MTLLAFTNIAEGVVVRLPYSVQGTYELNGVWLEQGAFLAYDEALQCAERLRGYGTYHTVRISKQE